MKQQREVLDYDCQGSTVGDSAHARKQHAHAQKRNFRNDGKQAQR